MKLFALGAFCILSVVATSAQNTYFHKGQATLQAGIGFFSTLGIDGNGLGITTPLKVPPISLTADFGVSDEISVGAYLATAKSDVYYQDIYAKIKIGSMSHFVFGVRGLYHFELTDALDTYGGAMLGYNVIKAKGYDDSQGKASGLTYTLLVGGKYNFSPNAGAFLELGYGVAAINLGLFLKLN